MQLPVTNPDRYNLMVGNTILGSGFSSRLYRDLRVKSGYVYSVDSQIDWTRTRCYYSVGFGADPDKVGPGAGAGGAGHTRPAGQPRSSDTELTRAKAQMLRRLPMQRASVDAVAALYLRLIDLGLPLDTPQVAAQHYYDATAGQVQAAFKAICVRDAGRKGRPGGSSKGARPWSHPESMDDDFRQAALDYHRYPRPGKIAIEPTKRMATQRDLALAYSPGVAAACQAIVADPRAARD